MLTKTTLVDLLHQRYGSLFFELRKLDYGWASFEVVWSDDGGATRIAAEMTADDMEACLTGAPPKHVAQLLDEARTADSDKEGG